MKKSTVFVVSIDNFKSLKYCTFWKKTLILSIICRVFDVIKEILTSEKHFKESNLQNVLFQIGLRLLWLKS